MAAPFVTISWTGFSPTMGSNGGGTPSTSGSLMNGESFAADKISRMLRRPQYRAQRRLLRTLNGVVAGSTAVENLSQVLGVQALNQPLAIGGLVPITSTPKLGATVAGRATTAADQTRLNNMIDRVVKPSTYVADLSGNGNGGNLGR